MGKYALVPSGKFRKDIKKYLLQSKTKKLITEVLDLLAENGYAAIPRKMNPHKLSGNYSGYWECHIQPDLLIIWEQAEEPINEIYLVRIGSHSELF